MMNSNAIVKSYDGTRASLSFRSVADATFNDYLTDLEPRGHSADSKAFRLALAASPDRRFRAFLDLIYYKRCDKWSLAAIARACDLTLAEFQAFWKNAQIDWAIDMAIGALPGITNDMVEDAHSVELICHECDGEGKVTDKDGKPHVCRACGGQGRIRRIGDAHSREKLLEMSGAIKKGPAVVINQDMRTVGM